MPWLMGIDEAGYGPNLGPFVMSAAGVWASDEAGDAWADIDLWHYLRRVVRRIGEPADSRLLVADSKQVYSPGKGLGELETVVLAFASTCGAEFEGSLRAWLQVVRPHFLDEMHAEPWFTGASSLPVAAAVATIAAAAHRLRQTTEDTRLRWTPFATVLICPQRFNALVDRWDSKSVILGEALGKLLTVALELPGDDPIRIDIDKHGGRNFYTAMLQNLLPRGEVRPREESSARSVYEIRGLGREIQIRFQPRADAEHFCVALASMFSKYLRELLMKEFNAFWQTHLPDLKPTAGYPMDAVRYFNAIRPVLQGLSIPDSAIWRKR